MCIRDRSDAGAERQEGLIARMGKGRGRLETDAGAPDAEGEVIRMIELQRRVQFDTHAAAATARADAFDGDRLGAVADAINVQINGVTDGDVAGVPDADAGVAGFRIGREVGLGARLAEGGDGDHFIFFNSIQTVSYTHL